VTICKYKAIIKERKELKHARTKYNYKAKARTQKQARNIQVLSDVK